MFLAIALASVAPASPPVSQPATATVRIIDATRANASQWSAAPANKKQEIIILEKDGRLVKLRLIEHE